MSLAADSALSRARTLTERRGLEIAQAFPRKKIPYFMPSRERKPAIEIGRSGDRTNSSETVAGSNVSIAQRYFGPLQS